MFLLVSKFEMIRMLLNVVNGKNPSTKGENTKRTKGPLIIYCLGGILGGITWFLGEQKGGSLKTLEGFRGGTTQIRLENEDMWGGGIAKVIKCY